MGSNGNTTELEVVNYDLLAARDTDEIQKLVQAATGRGIFFLDLRGPLAETAVADLKPILKAQRKFFAQPIEEKEVYSSDLPERGLVRLFILSPSCNCMHILTFYRYEEFDHASAETLLVCPPIQPLGLPNLIVNIQLSREEEVDGTLKIPKDLQPVTEKLKNVSSFSDTAMRDLVSILSTTLSPPVPTGAINNPSKPGKSNLTLGLASAPAGTDLIPSHADSGIITILYYDTPTLEILEPVTQEWEVVQPVEGLHVVYVGQALQALSNGRLVAALHRVKQPKDSTAMVVYLLHPGEE